MVLAAGTFYTDHTEGAVPFVDVGPIVVGALFVTSAHLTDGRFLVPIVVFAIRAILANESLVSGGSSMLFHVLNVLLLAARRLGKRTARGRASRAEGGAAAGDFLDRHARLATCRHLVAVYFTPRVAVCEQEVVLAEMSTFGDRVTNIGVRHRGGD